MNIGYQINATDVAYAAKEETIYDQTSGQLQSLEYAIQRLEEALKRVMKPAATGAIAVDQETKVPVSTSSEHKEWFKRHSRQIKDSTERIQEIIDLLDIQ